MQAAPDADSGLVVPPSGIARPIFLKADHVLTEVLRGGPILSALIHQIAFLQVREGGVEHDGEKWTWQTLAGLGRHMPGVSKRSLRRALARGRELRLVHTRRKNKGLLLRVDLAAVAGLRGGEYLRWDVGLAEAAGGGSPGRNVAALLHRVHTLAAGRSGVARDGRVWAMTTAAALAGRLRLGRRSIERALQAGRGLGLVKSERGSDARGNRRLLLRVLYDAVAAACGEAGGPAPPWTRPSQQAMLPVLAEADVAQVLDAFGAELLEGMQRLDWIDGPDDSQVRTLRREIAAYAGPTPPEWAAPAILATVEKRRPGSEIGLAVTLTRDVLEAVRRGGDPRRALHLRTRGSPPRPSYARESYARERFFFDEPPQPPAARETLFTGDDTPQTPPAAGETLFTGDDTPQTPASPRLVASAALPPPAYPTAPTYHQPAPVEVRLWSRILGRIRETIPAPAFQTWFTGTSGVWQGMGEFQVRAPSAFVAAELDRRYSAIIGDAFEAERRERPELRFFVSRKP